MTPRQKAIARTLLTAGTSSVKIASLVKLSASTVDRELTRLRGMMRVGSRKDLRRIILQDVNLLTEVMGVRRQG